MTGKALLNLENKMSITLPGYEIIQAIHEGWNTVIYRANYLPAVTSVIIKTLKAEYPPLEDISRLRHEYKILQPLNLEGVIKPLALENYQNGLALILEDFGKASLKAFISNHSINLRHFLQIAIKIVAALEKLHQNKIIHKDIKPHNILISPELEEIKIIDFSIATRLRRENAAYSSLNLLEGLFFTTKPIGKGTGLGLSLSHQIVVEKHGGNFQYISAPGEGTEFIVQLPIKQEKG